MKIIEMNSKVQLEEELQALLSSCATVDKTDHLWTCSLPMRAAYRWLDKYSCHMTNHLVTLLVTRSKVKLAFTTAMGIQHN